MEYRSTEAIAGYIKRYNSLEQEYITEKQRLEGLIFGKVLVPTKRKNTVSMMPSPYKRKLISNKEIIRCITSGPVDGLSITDVINQLYGIQPGQFPMVAGYREEMSRLKRVVYQRLNVILATTNEIEYVKGNRKGMYTYR